ncbi:MAG: RusA family crossover junction endodeoxyribonuclease [Eubacteriales bacterium]|nr:RusA family crossover junction endodeoxyribonuclease [Eubacteriales bacterium]
MKNENIIVFFMNMVPPTATKQQRKVDWQHRRIYDSDQVKEAKAKLEAHLYKHKPSAPLSGAICLTTIWRYPRGKSHKDGEYKVTRPDVDNMPTLLMDCMTRLGFWNDDAQVAHLQVVKVWHERPGIEIMIENMPVTKTLTEE